MKKSLLTLALSTSVLASTALVSTQAAAVEGLSANASVTSNYLWRGLQQTGGEAAVQGGIDYEASSGFYVGTWASNASWAPGMTYELDVYGGFAGDISESVSFDVGYIYYSYLDAVDSNDFSEVYGSISWNSLDVGVAVLATAEDNDFGDSIYVNADYTFDLGNDLELALHVGSYSGDFVGDDSLLDFGASLAKDNFTFGMSKSDIEGSGTDDDVKFYVSYAVDFDL